MEVLRANPSTDDLAPHHTVGPLRELPEPDTTRVGVRHLPDDVAQFFSDSIRVLDAGVPDAAAVQLRRTLEAAAAAKGITTGTLVSRVSEMINQGMVTRDFGAVLTHVRRLGNIGAHASDIRLSQEDVERALRFTTQFLRNVFEVPGELAELEGGEEGESDG